jgi:transglutaminase-like putative cysteine protease
VRPACASAVGMTLLLAASALGAEAVVEARPGAPRGEAVEPMEPLAAWPLPELAEPGLVALAVRAQSLEELAAAIRAQQATPRGRVKAVHDAVVLRLSYAPHAPGQPQDARSAFARRTANCEGYARLFAELVRLVGERAVYIPGLALEDGALSPVWHAWNAVWLDERWELVDVTFDDPTVRGAGPAESYRTDYLFVPPEVAALDHLPLERRWQLLPRPVSRESFVGPRRARAPSVRQGLQVLEPGPGPVQAGAPLEVRVDNPRGHFVLVTLDEARCGLGGSAVVAVTCPPVPPGAHRVQVLSNSEETGLFLSVLTFEVVAR